MDERTEIDRNVSIQALRRNTRDLLSALLNSEMIRNTEEGYHRNWIGLACLCNIKSVYFATLEGNVNPTDRVLQLWHEQDPDDSTIDKLLSHLNKLKRKAVINRILSNIDEDIEIYKKPPFQPRPLNLSDESNILTNDDWTRYNQGLDPQQYDAFVLFAEDDIDFATELIDTMEKQYHMKFCVKDRDLLSRGIQISVVIKLITERCKRLIIILSDAFFKSQANTFFLQFTQSFGIMNRQHKIIPCIYKEITEMPPELKVYFNLDYRRSFRYGSFWQILYRAIGTSYEGALTRSKSETNNAVESPVEKKETTSLKPQNHVQFKSTEALYTPPETPTSTPSLPMLPSPLATLSNGNEPTCDKIKPTKTKKRSFKNRLFKLIKRNEKKVALPSS